MRSMTRLGGGLFVLGLAGLWSQTASATMCAGQPAECGTCTISEPQTTCAYTPARVTTAVAGDVALNTSASANPAVQAFLMAMATGFAPQVPGGLTYMHTKLLTDATGNHFTETFPADMPPNAHTTGEDWCSRPISPFFLARLNPGTAPFSDTTAGSGYSVSTGSGVFYEDAQPGAVVTSFGTAGCTLAPEPYAINSFMHDDVTGGSCEKALVDHCGVPVLPGICTPATCGTPSATGDRTSYTNATFVTVATNVWNAAYNACQALQSDLSWFVQLGESIECGGVSISQLCGRMAWQVVNEIAFKANPMEDNPPVYESGWSDVLAPGAGANQNGPYPPANYNVWTGGPWLGAAKTNFQVYPTGTCPAGVSCSGYYASCQSGDANGAPVACAGWGPTTFTANVPDNIVVAAKRTGHPVTTVASGSGITPGANVCTTCDICVNSKTCDGD
jgi:hypothetical protein